MTSAVTISAGRAKDVISATAAFFAERGVAVWVTGGFLRGCLLGRDAYDVDLAIAADPLQIGPELAESLGGHYFPLREERGQARVLLPGRGLHIDLIPLRVPDIVGDLRVRDFTVDALAAPLSEVVSGEVTMIDPTGGLTDLHERRVRMTAESAFVDDPLRLLRGPRIATELSFEIDESTATAIRRHAAEITSAAPERQRDEIIRICATDRAGEGFGHLENLGLFMHVFPEMEATKGVEQPKEHYYDVFGHSLAAAEALDWLLAEHPPADAALSGMWDDLWGQLAWCEGLREYFVEELVPGTSHRSLLKLCGLLHDIAKPQTKSFEPNGRMRFFGHSEKGAEIATGLMRRLRFSSRETQLVGAMIDAHLRPLQLGQEGPPSRRAVYRFFRDTQGGGIDTLFLSLADHLASVGPRVTMDGFRRHGALISYILQTRFADGDQISPPKLVDGDVLMSALRLEPGPILGELLEAVREAQATGEVETAEQAIDLARSLLAASRTAERK